MLYTSILLLAIFQLHFSSFHFPFFQCTFSVLSFCSSVCVYFFCISSIQVYLGLLFDNSVTQFYVNFLNVNETTKYTNIHKHVHIYSSYSYSEEEKEKGRESTGTMRRWRNWNPCKTNATEPNCSKLKESCCEWKTKFNMVSAIDWAKNGRFSILAKVYVFFASLVFFFLFLCCHSFVYSYYCCLLALQPLNGLTVAGSRSLFSFVVRQIGRVLCEYAREFYKSIYI